jgi:hypothetical protein
MTYNTLEITVDIAEYIKSIKLLLIIIFKTNYL